MQNNEIYEKITSKIIDSLSRGVIPWKKPFINHQNFISKKSYSGINRLVLSSSDFESPYWMTFKQCKQLGGSIKKGEKGTPIIFYAKITNEEELENQGEEDDKQKFILKFSYVFNLCQIEGVEINNSVPERKNLMADDLITTYSKKVEIISLDQSRAYYSFTLDVINLPKKNFFVSPEEMYSTTFHEMVHSTGHHSRLNRKGFGEKMFYGSHDYSVEELVAEIGASFLCSICGIDSSLENSESYIKGWLAVRGKNPKYIIEASREASKACDYILKEMES